MLMKRDRGSHPHDHDLAHHVGTRNVAYMLLIFCIVSGQAREQQHADRADRHHHRRRFEEVLTTIATSRPTRP